MPFKNPTTTLPADAITGKIPGSQIEGAVGQAVEVTGPINGGQLVNGTVQLPHLESAIKNALAQKWWDFGADAGKWAVQGTAAKVSVSTPDASGGTAMRVTGYAIMYRPDVLIPFDPRVLYRVSVTVRQVTAGSNPANQRVYAGIAGIAADRTTFVNTEGANGTGSQAYAAARGTNLTAGAGWQTFTGYIKGYATTTGDAGTNPSLLNPMKLHPNVRYLTPLLYLNYTGGTGAAEVDMVTIEAVPAGPVDGAVQIIPGTVVANALSADAIDGKTVNAVVFNGGQINGTQINGVDITGTSTVTGATVRTSSAGRRIVMAPDGSLYLYSGAAGETGPASLAANVISDSGGEMKRGTLTLTGPTHGAHSAPEMTLSVDPTGTRQWRIGPMLAWEDNIATGLTLLGSQLVTGDVDVFGKVTAGNFRSGQVSITPVVDTPTSFTVTGLALTGTPRIVVTPNTQDPYTRVRGVSVSSVTANGFTVWLTRTTATATIIYWQAMGS